MALRWIEGNADELRCDTASITACSSSCVRFPAVRVAQFRERRPCWRELHASGGEGVEILGRCGASLHAWVEARRGLQPVVETARGARVTSRGCDRAAQISSRRHWRTLSSTARWDRDIEVWSRRIAASSSKAARNVRVSRFAVAQARGQSADDAVDAYGPAKP